MHRSTATGTKDTGSGPRVACCGQPVQAGSPDVTGPPVAVGTGVLLTDGGELVAVLPVADPPPAPPPAPGDGAETVPHPAASAPAASSGTDASSAARPRCRANLANPAIPACGNPACAIPACADLASLASGVVAMLM